MKRAHKGDLSSVVMDSSFLFRRCVVVITKIDLYLRKLYTVDSRYRKKFKITVLRRYRPDANSDCDSYL
jgi:hypothetical protein